MPCTRIRIARRRITRTLSWPKKPPRNQNTVTISIVLGRLSLFDKIYKSQFSNHSWHRKFLSRRLRDSRRHLRYTRCKNGKSSTTPPCKPSATYVYNMWMLEVNLHLLNITRGVCVCGLAIYIKKYLKAKEEEFLMETQLHFTMQKHNLQKKSSKTNQNPFKILL